MFEGRVVDCNMDGLSSFSSDLFAVFVCYLKVEDAGSGEVLWNAVYVNCTGDMTIVFIDHGLF